MKIIELLNESTIEVVGDFDQLLKLGLANDDISSYRSNAEHLVKNQIPVWKNKLAKSPVDIKIIFDFEAVPGPVGRGRRILEKKYQSEMTGNNMCVVVILDKGSGVWPLLSRIEYKSTLWMFIHDIGEAIIPQLIEHDNSVFVENIHSILVEFVKRNYSCNNNSITTIPYHNRWASRVILAPMLTMKSARDFRGTHSGHDFKESLVEMFVQIILTGSLKLDDPAETLNFGEVFHLDNNYHSSETRKLEQQLQQCIISHILENNTTPIVVQYGRS
jgi:hypothetical protein